MKGFLLFILSVVLFAIVVIPGALVSLVMLFIKDDRKLNKGLSKVCYQIALSVDMLGNVICGDLANITLIKPGGYQFGRSGGKDKLRARKECRNVPLPHRNRLVAYRHIALNRFPSRI